MQKNFKNHKTLIGVIGLAMLGMGNAQAISSFNKPASVRPGVSHIVSDPEVSDSLVQKGQSKYVSKDSIAVSNYPPTLPIKAVGQFAVESVGDGWLIGGPGIDALLSTQAYRYSDVLNAAVDHGTAVGQVDGLATLIPSHFDAATSKMLSAEVPANESPEASPVPLPAAAWSFLIGLLGILGLKKRKSPPSETS